MTHVSKTGIRDVEAYELQCLSLCLMPLILIDGLSKTFLLVLYTILKRPKIRTINERSIHFRYVSVTDAEGNTYIVIVVVPLSIDSIIYTIIDNIL